MPATLATISCYDTAALFAATEQAERTDLITTRALLFYEGRHTSMSGKSRAYSKEDLEAIAAATNDWMAKGRRVKLYVSDADHQRISQGAVAGYLVGVISLQQITAADLPLPGLEDLIGLWGLFSTIQIAGADNCAQYLDGRLKELSIGLTADNIVIEVSAVSISALAGAALFRSNLAADSHALTLGETQRELTEGRDLWDLWDQFTTTLANISRASPEELGDRDPAALRSQLVDDFARQLANRLQVSLTPLPAFNSMPDEIQTPPAQSAPDAERFAALEAENRSLREEVTALQNQNALNARFATLRDRATALRDSGRIDPAEFNEYFAPAAVQQFSQPNGAALLDKIEFWLERCAKKAPAQFGLPTDPQITSEQATTTADSFLEGYTPRTVY